MITSVATLLATGKPVLFWANRLDPYIIASKVTAFSGKMGIVKAKLSSKAGLPMIVNFRLAKQAHISAWAVYFNTTTSFATTVLADYFSTGYKVIFDPQNPIRYQNEILKDQAYDIEQTIFSSKPGLDYFMGTLNLIITQ